MPVQASYLLLELAVLAYLLGFSYEYWRFRRLFSRTFFFPAVSLAVIWFSVDSLALHLALWEFPSEGNLPLRLLGLPLEEYILFFLHTLVCFILVEQYSAESK